MAYKNYKQVMAVRRKYELELLKIFPDTKRESGIYILYRVNDLGEKVSYVGQAKNVVERMGSHIATYSQHIDRSLSTHGLKTSENPKGWNMKVIYCKESELDVKEQYYIGYMVDLGYRPYNVTTGGQGEGKQKLGEYAPRKGYRDGIKQGERNTQKFITGLFEKHLDVKTKSDNPNAYQRKALEKFNDFLKGEEEE